MRKTKQKTLKGLEYL